MITQNAISVDKETPKPKMIESYPYFSTPIVKVTMPEYVDMVKKVAMESLYSAPEEYKDMSMHELYPMRHSLTFHSDERIQDFTQEVIQLGWDILNSQGYQMENLMTAYEAMWMQEHHKTSGMEQHVHPGTYLVGFYFIDVPENSSRMILHDPRPGKVQVDLPQSNSANITFATSMVNFAPEPGDLFFVPAWLPHSFTRHGNEDPIRFVHINIGVTYLQQQNIDQPEGPIII